MRRLLTSFVSTLGVGSTWDSGILDVCDFKTFVGVCHVASSNLSLTFDQSGVSSYFDVSSGVAAPAGNNVLNWTGLADYARLSVTATNSTQGELIRLHVYGIPV